MKYLDLLIAASASWTATSHFAFSFGFTRNAAANLWSHFFVYQKQILCIKFEVLTFVIMKIAGLVECHTAYFRKKEPTASIKQLKAADFYETLLLNTT